MNTPHPVILHPRVPITKLSGKYEARCHHCDWGLAGTIRAYLDEQAKYHRHMHRTGQAPTWEGTTQ